MSSTKHPGDRQPALVAHRDHEGDRLAGFRFGPVAVPGRFEVGDPRAGEEPADQHQPQQGQHGAGEQPDVEDDRDDQNDHDGQKPEHQTMTLELLVGTGDRVEQLVDQHLAVTLRNRLSGFKMIRWQRMAGASRLMSSGVMNSWPRIAAIACEAR